MAVMGARVVNAIDHFEARADEATDKMMEFGNREGHGDQLQEVLGFLNQLWRRLEELDVGKDASPSYAVRAENDQGIRTYVDFRPKSSLQVGVWRGQWGGRMVGGAEAAGEVQAQAAQ